MTQTPDRPGIDHLTSDMLDQLYTRLDKAERAVTCWKTRARIRAQQRSKAEQRAERAEATLNAVRELAQQWQSGMRPGESHPAARAVLDVLDQHGQTTA